VREIGLRQLGAQVVKISAGLRIAPSMAAIFSGPLGSWFDDPENPTSLEQVIRVLGRGGGRLRGAYQVAAGFRSFSRREAGGDGDVRSQHERS